MSSPANRDKLIKMLLILMGILLVVGVLSSLHKKSALSLSDYAEQQTGAEDSGKTSGSSEENGAQESLPTDSSDKDGSKADSQSSGDSTPENSEEDEDSRKDPGHAINDGNENSKESRQDGDETDGDEAGDDSESGDLSLIGEVLNSSLAGESMLEQRAVYADGFYYEPLSDAFRRYITGFSASADADFDSLVYAHILYCDMEGETAPGELICSADAAKDLVEIFYELYRNDYRFTKVGLIEEYDGDVEKAMAENLTFCLARPEDPLPLLPGLSDGLCMVVNPLYNPLAAYQSEGETLVTPKEGASYADRTLSFAYKIDEDDLCCKLFLQHGFTWGGNRNDGKAYCAFQLKETR